MAISGKDSAVSSIDSESLDAGSTPKQIPKTDLVKRHGKFYFDDGSVELMVDNVLYNVHRSIFEHNSSWFCERFQQPVDSLPAGWQVHQITPNKKAIFVNHALERVSSAHPRPKGSHGDAIALDGITSSEFDSLLAVLYPQDYNQRRLTTREEWTNVLKLATLWSFSSIRSLAIRHLGTSVILSCFDRLVLASTYKIEDWTKDALNGLCTRKEILSTDELRAMTPEDIFLVISTRERARTAQAQVVRDKPETVKSATIAPAEVQTKPNLEINKPPVPEFKPFSWGDHLNTPLTSKPDNTRNQAGPQFSFAKPNALPVPFFSNAQANV